MEDSIFGTEFTDDQEMMEMMDQLLLFVGEQIKKEDERMSIINPYRIQELLYTYKILKALTFETGAEVTYKMHEPFKTTGCVSVLGDVIIFENPKLLAKATELASNVEICPKTDGSVQIDFTFHGLTVPIEK